MPRFRLKNPATGEVLYYEGDKPPSQSEAADIFVKQRATNEETRAARQPAMDWKQRFATSPYGSVVEKVLSPFDWHPIQGAQDIGTGIGKAIYGGGLEDKEQFPRFAGARQALRGIGGVVGPPLMAAGATVAPAATAAFLGTAGATQYAGQKLLDETEAQPDIGGLGVDALSILLGAKVGGKFLPKPPIQPEILPERQVYNPWNQRPPMTGVTGAGFDSSVPPVVRPQLGPENISQQPPAPIQEVNPFATGSYRYGSTGNPIITPPPALKLAAGQPAPIDIPGMPTSNEVLAPARPGYAPEGPLPDIQAPVRSAIEQPIEPVDVVPPERLMRPYEPSGVVAKRIQESFPEKPVPEETIDPEFLPEIQRPGAMKQFGKDVKSELGKNLSKELTDWKSKIEARLAAVEKPKEVKAEVIQPRKATPDEVLPPEEPEMPEGAPVVQRTKAELQETPQEKAEMEGKAPIDVKAREVQKSSLQPNVTLYRGEYHGPPGNIPDWIMEGLEESGGIDAKGRWFTDDPEIAKWYKNEAGEQSRITRIIVPRDIAEKAKISNQPAEVARYSADKGTEYFVPREIADTAEEVQEPPKQLTAGTVQHPSQAAYDQALNTLDINNLDSIEMAIARGQESETPRLQIFSDVVDRLIKSGADPVAADKLTRFRIKRAFGYIEPVEGRGPEAPEFVEERPTRLGEVIRKKRETRKYGTGPPKRGQGFSWGSDADEPGDPTLYSGLDPVRAGKSIKNLSSDIIDEVTNPEGIVRKSFSGLKRLPEIAKMKGFSGNHILEDSEFPQLQRIGQQAPNIESAKMRDTAQYIREYADAVRGLSDKQKLDMVDYMNGDISNVEPNVKIAAKKIEMLAKDIRDEAAHGKAQVGEKVGFIPKNYFPHMQSLFANNSDFMAGINDLMSRGLPGALGRIENIFKEGEAGKTSVFGEPAAHPDSPHTQRRTSPIMENMERDPDRVFPIYIEGMMRAKWDLPFVKKAEQLMQGVSDGPYKDFARDYLRNYARADSPLGADRATAQLSSWIMRKTANALLTGDTRLWMLHLSRIANMWQDIPTKYMAKAIAEMSNPKTALREINRVSEVGLLPQRLKPFEIMSLGERINDIRYLGSFFDSVPDAVGLRAAELQNLDKGMSPGDAELKAITTVKTSGLRTTPATSIKFFNDLKPELRPMFQFRQIQAKMIEQYMRNTTAIFTGERGIESLSPGERASLAGRMLMGTGAQLAGRVAGLSTWHLALYGIGGGAFATEAYRMGKMLAAGKYEDAAKEAVLWWTGTKHIVQQIQEGKPSAIEHDTGLKALNPLKGSFTNRAPRSSNVPDIQPVRTEIPSVSRP